MSFRRSLLLVAAFAPYAVLLASHLPKQAAKVSFGRDVKPILKSHCGSCHSGETAAAKLDLLNTAFRTRGKLVVPGDPAHSVLLQRILGQGGKPQMPMGFAPLSADQIETVRAWIAQGGELDAARAETHWAYVPPVAPALPPVKQKSWVRNPIDSFVLSRLEKESMRPSPEASKETLLRRASLDLTGLPPTLREIDAFLADHRPDAYERQVDRLLASPAYGEKMARGWLDLARFADSDGYEKDLKRVAWKYRDWVIDAFNRNLPYDRFTIDQLAGDMLPNATLDDKIATGFHRNTMFNAEGGVDQAEAHFAVILDRVDTTATVWLGSTLGCARCHDHKYDPFTQKDYYRMAAFFNNTRVIPRGPKEVSEEKWREPELRTPTAQQSAEELALQCTLTKLNRQLEARKAEDSAYQTWRQELKTPTNWEVANVTKATAESGNPLAIQSDGTLLATGKTPQWDAYTLELDAPAGATGLCLEALPDDRLPSHGPGLAANGNFVLSGIALSAGSRGIPLGGVAADYSQPEFEPARALVHDKKSGWAVDGQVAKHHELILELPDNVASKGTLVTGTVPVKLVLEFRSEFANHILGRFRVSFTRRSHPAAFLLPQTLTAGTPSEEDLKKAFIARDPATFQIRQAIQTSQQKLDQLNAEVPSALVLEEVPHVGPLTEYVRRRGEFLGKADKVEADAPAILPRLSAPVKNRLTLAKWLVSHDNPLTARVEVNRLWEQCFGRGIVETSEDFGTRGSPPTHKELLDWMACKLRDSGWNIKATLRLIVTSAAYRQSSAATEEGIKRDPLNLLIARGPRFRVEAETIRDIALASGGMLSRKIGGPSVYPDQPDNIWDSPYSGETWNPSQGENRFRRGLYTFWKRTAPYPSYLAFDATSRESCTVRRIRTNTPLQALAMLNDQVILEASRGLSRRMISTPGSEEHKLATGFRLCTGRAPKTPEVSRLKGLLVRLESRYKKDPASAKKLAGDPVSAAWTMVGNVLLNLDETITKG